jgi:hypothetical protein
MLSAGTMDRRGYGRIPTDGETSDSGLDLDEVVTVAEATGGIVKATLDLVAHLTIKELFVPALLIAIGAALLAIRDVLFELTTWSTTELVALTVTWDAWVVYQDYVDLESDLLIAGLEILSDALRFLGIHFLPKFSLKQILRNVVGPIISPAELISSLHKIAACEEVSSGADIFGLSLKVALNDSVCPTVRYFKPTSLGWFFNLFEFLTYGTDNNCECNTKEYPCERVDTCIVLNAGYLFIDLLLPLFLIGLLLYFLLFPVLRLAYDVVKDGVSLAFNLVEDTLGTITDKIKQF